MIIPYLILAGKPEILASFLPIQLLQNGDLSAAKDQRHHSFIIPRGCTTAMKPEHSFNFDRMFSWRPFKLL